MAAAGLCLLGTVAMIHRIGRLLVPGHEEPALIAAAVTAAPVPRVRNVTVHEPESAYPGYNLYCSGHAAEAVLMDMSGNTLHRWHYAWDRAWPDYVPPADGENHLFWRRVHLLPNGELLAIFEGIGLIKLDRDSKLLWTYDRGAHHDLAVREDGSILVLAREPRLLPHLGVDEPVLEDYVVTLDADGRERARISILEALENSPYARGALERIRRLETGDVLHTNTVEPIDERLDRSPRFEVGQILISILRLDLVGVLDPGRRSLVWAMTGSFRSQHQPTVVERGNLLLFDNIGQPGRSRVLEIDPLSERVLWTYGEADGEAFYSRTCGSSERLPNGNTLITESTAGRAFEIAPDRRVVWEFFNPNLTPDGEFIATLFEVVRLPEDFPTHWVQGPR